MCRSVKKPLFVDRSVLKWLNKLTKNNFKKKKLRLYSRRSTIFQSFLDCSVSIYNGKSFFFLLVSKLYIGLKFGEFSFSKKRSVLIHIHTKVAKKAAVLKK